MFLCCFDTGEVQQACLGLLLGDTHLLSCFLIAPPLVTCQESYITCEDRWGLLCNGIRLVNPICNLQPWHQLFEEMVI